MNANEIIPYDNISINYETDTDKFHIINELNTHKYELIRYERISDKISVTFQSDSIINDAIPAYTIECDKSNVSHYSYRLMIGRVIETIRYIEGTPHKAICKLINLIYEFEQYVLYLKNALQADSYKYSDSFILDEYIGACIVFESKYYEISLRFKVSLNGLHIWTTPYFDNIRISTSYLNIDELHRMLFYKLNQPYVAHDENGCIILKCIDTNIHNIWLYDDFAVFECHGTTAKVSYDFPGLRQLIEKVVGDI